MTGLATAVAVLWAIVIAGVAAALVRHVIAMAEDAELDQLIVEFAQAIETDREFGLWYRAEMAMHEFADGTVRLNESLRNATVALAAFGEMIRDAGDYDDTCQTCGGEGMENVCADDMCASSDECIHGDGMIVCRTCGGAGFV